MASACARIVASSTLSWKWFQLFQPMGGVCARLWAGAANGTYIRTASAEAPSSRKNEIMRSL